MGPAGDVVGFDVLDAGLAEPVEAFGEEEGREEGHDAGGEFFPVCVCVYVSMIDKWRIRKRATKLCMCVALPLCHTHTQHTHIPKNGEGQAGLSDGIAGVFIQQFDFHVAELPEEEGLGDAPEEEGEDET